MTKKLREASKRKCLFKRLLACVALSITHGKRVHVHPDEVNALVLGGLRERVHVRLHALARGAPALRGCPRLCVEKDKKIHHTKKTLTQAPTLKNPVKNSF